MRGVRDHARDRHGTPLRGRRSATFADLAALFRAAAPGAAIAVGVDG